MESEEHYTDQYIPTLLNSEPVVMFGLNETELMVSIGFGLFCAMVGVIVIATFASLGVFFLILFLLFTGVFAAIAMKWFRNSKSGKPRGYVGMKMKVTLGKRFPNLVNSSRLYIDDEPLCIGRSVRKLIEVEQDDEQS